ncbi:MAG: PAS domain-containing protein, partial [Proteobacteria bacterium]|nr:PAS domain-containing protein [Pseudomonadota bacterium]MBU1738344.1 PAS domain-containing protein [Pseudomonadota bacterium]
MDYENFYDSLKYHLQQKGHGGQALVCRQAKIPRSYLSRIMNRGRRAGKKTQMKIARFFGFGLEEFVEIGRRITLGENPDASVDLLLNMSEEHLLQRLTAAVRKEVVTARKLDRSTLLYESIVENSRQIIVRFDERMAISFVNRSTEILTGHERVVLIGKDCSVLVAKAHRQELLMRIGELKNSGGSFSMEVPGHYNNKWLYITVT